MPAYLVTLMESKLVQTAVKGCQNADEWLQVYLNSALTRREVETRFLTFTFVKASAPLLILYDLNHYEQS